MNYSNPGNHAKESKSPYRTAGIIILVLVAIIAGLLVFKSCSGGKTLNTDTPPSSIIPPTLSKLPPSLSLRPTVGGLLPSRQIWQTRRWIRSSSDFRSTEPVQAAVVVPKTSHSPVRERSPETERSRLPTMPWFPPCRSLFRSRF